MFSCRMRTTITCCSCESIEVATKGRELDTTDLNDRWFSLSYSTLLYIKTSLIRSKVPCASISCWSIDLCLIDVPFNFHHWASPSYWLLRTLHLVLIDQVSEKGKLKIKHKEMKWEDKETKKKPMLFRMKSNKVLRGNTYLFIGFLLENILAIPRAFLIWRYRICQLEYHQYALGAQGLGIDRAHT